VIVNKSQLVRAVSESTALARRVAEDVVDVLFDMVITEVRSGRKVAVVGFGTFVPITRAARMGRNPRTGSAIPIPASKGVRFVTGSAFKSALNSKEGAPMAVKKAAVKKAPAKKAVVKKAPAKKAVVKKAVVKKAVVKKAPAKKAVVKKAPAKKAVVKKAVVKKAPAKKAVVKKAVVKKAVVKKAPAKKAAR